MSIHPEYKVQIYDLMYYFQDLKLKEVADIIGIGLPLVKYRIGKAKELLSVYLGDKK